LQLLGSATTTPTATTLLFGYNQSPVNLFVAPEATRANQKNEMITKMPFKNGTFRQTEVSDKPVRKSKNHAVKRQISLFSSGSPLLDPSLSLSGLTDLKPIELGNPFTPNPLMSLFTNVAAGRFTTILPRIPKIKSPGNKLPKLRFPEPAPLPDPFYSPLIPKNATKIWDELFGPR
uniref:GAE domain-containing protein n=1 Tax=Gongylonema pulchrum TaxID=637853 RepID=A0A183DD82_9BILA